jgi:hypothetical protein
VISNIKQRVDDMIVVRSPSDMLLPPLGGGDQKVDDAFVILRVAAPVQPCFAGELVKLYVNDHIAFSWPLDDLVERYRNFAEARPPAAMAGVHETILLISQKLAESWRSQNSKDPSRELLDQTTSLGVLLQGFSHAIAEYAVEPAIVLSRAIPVPPRSTLRVEATNGGKVSLYLRGLRTMAMT